MMGDARQNDELPLFCEYELGNGTIGLDKHYFTYWKDEKEAFIKKEGICHCCERQVNEYHISHSKWWCGWKKYLSNQNESTQLKNVSGELEADYELQLCYECISSGSAAEKFHVKLNWVEHISDDCSALGKDEVELRTPSYRNNKEIWPVHCGEACEYLGKYAVDMDCLCHEFQCRQCGEILSIMEHNMYPFGEP